jgi:ketosteroid isomerase-like protein/ribosomal protein L24E
LEENTNIQKQRTCPYCQTKIKSGADIITCRECGTTHHKECWEENNGCTTFGCINNPNTKKSSPAVIDVGNETVENIQQMITAEALPAQDLTNCPKCNSLIEQNSVFCKFCGYNLREGSVRERAVFEEEFKKRYREKASFTRRRMLLTAVSIFIIFAALTVSAYVIYDYVNNYFSSEEFAIKNRVTAWEKAWESRNIDKYRAFLTDDYMYTAADGKKYNYSQRIERIEYTFQNYRYIVIDISDVEVKESENHKEATVTFKESYTSDKFEEEGNKTLKMRKDNGEWMIYAETFK